MPAVCRNCCKCRTHKLRHQAHEVPPFYCYCGRRRRHGAHRRNRAPAQRAANCCGNACAASEESSAEALNFCPPAT
eukprot:528662-Amphidinium_carterae.1